MAVLVECYHDSGFLLGGIMISRDDAMFTIGYEGLQAVVDGKARARYRKLSSMELARQGLFRAAFASVLYGNDASDFQAFASYYNEAAGTSFKTIDDFKRLFGVNQENVRRLLVL
jgi:hypothetical protein